MRIRRQLIGQTLIETMAALFILTMGISASVGLAVYALGSSGSVIKQIVATGLAREGVEAVKNMRDTNWLRDTLKDPVLNPPGCYDYATASSTAGSCYPNWIGGGSVPYCIDPVLNNPGNCTGSNAASAPYFVGYDGSSSGTIWTLTKDVGGNLFGLQYNASPASTGFYDPAGGVTCTNSPGRSDYCREIIISKDTATLPYNLDPKLSLVKIRSQVWWIDKRCPRAQDFASAPKSCRLEVDSYLTNWRNY